MKLAKILLPVDFSERGVGAARYASGLAQHFGSELTLLHVNEFSVARLTAPSGLGRVIDMDWVGGFEKQLLRELENYQRGEFRHVTLQTAVLTGDPASKILAYAEEQKTELIVMPTRGYGPFRRFMLGSVTAKVLDAAECPVWTGAHMEDTTPHRWKIMNHVLCAIDGGSSSEPVVDWAWRFAEEFNSLFTVVHAVPHLDAPPGVVDSTWLKDRFANIEAQIRCIVNRVGARGDVLVEEGSPRNVVAAAARRLNTDVVVIGRSAPDRFLGRLRPNAYAIVSDSPCPVVSL